MKTIITRLLALVVATTQVLGVAPPNDECIGASALTAGLPFAMSTTQATSAGNPVPGCQANFGRGKGGWFRLTAPADMFVRLTTCGSDFDTVLQVYTGSCEAFAPVTCSDDGGWHCIGLQASVWFAAKAGTDYSILVGGYAGASGNLVLQSPPEIIDLHRNANGTLTIGWVGGALLRAPDVGGPYSEVFGASSPFTFSPAEGRGFFRLRP